MNNSGSRDKDIEIIRQIDAYLKGDLSPREAERLWVDLIKNPEYLEYLETELSLKSLGDNEETGQARENVTVSDMRRSWKWLAAAASIALFILLLNLFVTDSQPALRDLALSEITIADNLASPEVVRSRENRLSEPDSLLNLGFRAALSGNMERALNLYQSVAEQYTGHPASSKAELNIGIIQYNRGNYRVAAQAFNEAKAGDGRDAIMEERTFWYLGNAYIHLDRLEDAREAIYRVYTLDGIYRKPAFRLLRKLDYELGNIDFENFEQGTVPEE